MLQKNHTRGKESPKRNPSHRMARATRKDRSGGAPVADDRRIPVNRFVFERLPLSFRPRKMPRTLTRPARLVNDRVRVMAGTDLRCALR
jgi:hypothetical protein